MADTNWGTLSEGEVTVWSRTLWKQARNLSFTNQFAGTDTNSMVQRIKELTKDEKGARAVITLLADLQGDGVVGDFELEGNEEAINAYDQVIQLDQLRHANRNTGRMSDQKVVVKFRESSRDVLAYWLADRLDQLAFLTLSGVAYTKKNNGANRPVLGSGTSGLNLSELAFAADVTAPTANRHLRWDAGTSSLITNASTADVVVDDKINYKMLVQAKAYAKDHYMRGIKKDGNEEVFHVFVTPQGMAQLKLDADYLSNVRSARERGTSNPLFAGTSSVMVDGLIVHEFRHVFNTKGAAGGSKWGAAGAVDGQRVLMCGAQALGLADIGDPTWVEETFDYKNKVGISVGKIFGLLKPQFHSNVTGAVEDFGVLTIDTAL